VFQASSVGNRAIASAHSHSQSLFPIQVFNSREMAELLLLRQSRRLMLSLSSRCHALAIRPYLQSTLNGHGFSTSSAQEQEEDPCANGRSKWLELSPFAPQIDTAALARKISGERAAGKSHESEATKTSAIKWVRRCCPDLPLSLVQKLFRLRQVWLAPPLWDLVSFAIAVVVSLSESSQYCLLQCLLFLKAPSDA
jgi:hypothetical protein